MNKRKFTIPGYSQFYRSLPRFYHGIDDAYALKFTYSLYLAVNSVYRYKNPGVIVMEYVEQDFYTLILQRKAKPYRTEVQLYRALELLLECLSNDALQGSQVHLLSELMELLHDSETRFYKAFDMEITDDRTIYWMCAKSLVPRRDEPGVCLEKDWDNICYPYLSA